MKNPSVDLSHTRVLYFYLSVFHWHAVWCVPALRVPLVHSQYYLNHFRACPAGARFILK